MPDCDEMTSWRDEKLTDEHVDEAKDVDERVEMEQREGAGESLCEDPQLDRDRQSGVDDAGDEQPTADSESNNQLRRAVVMARRRMCFAGKSDKDKSSTVAKSSVGSSNSIVVSSCGSCCSKSADGNSTSPGSAVGQSRPKSRLSTSDSDSRGKESEEDENREPADDVEHRTAASAMAV